MYLSSVVPQSTPNNEFSHSQSHSHINSQSDQGEGQAVCVTYKSKGSKQDPYSRLDGGHPLQLLGCHLAVPSDDTWTHGN